MYRYTEKQYLESFMNTGSIRVGTLHNFRSNEHAKGITDAGEGMKNVHHNFENSTITGRNIVSPFDVDGRAFRAFGFIGLEEGATVNLQNVTFERKIEHPDCYILCSSLVASKETMAEFSGADSCIQIIDIAGFYRCLTEALRKKSSRKLMWKGHHNVMYQDRQEKWNGLNWGNSPAVIKSKDFAKQFETRGIWLTEKGKTIKPEIVVDIRLPRFCRVINL